MMPAKKRTNQTKRTPATPPTASTSHESADQHHRLRHAGPSISARSSLSATSSKPPPARSHPESTPEGSHTQEKKLSAEVSPPGARTPFSKFLYVLLLLVLLLLGWYVYGMITLLERLKEDVGWWGIIAGNSGLGKTGRGGPEGWGFRSDGVEKESGRDEAGKGGDLEGSLNALADALGISPVQVASAVKLVVPPASLRSIAHKSEGTGGSEAVRVLFEDTTRSGEDAMRIVEESAERMARGVVEENLAEDGVV